MVWTGALAEWYAANGRHHLPWRHTRDPWEILVSEVMLAQTPVSRVQGRWEAFLERWPDPSSCAAAPLDEILRLWRGLGYPRRARNLHLCAASVARDGWPRSEAGLRALPGIGAYTARALLTFAWERPTGPACEVNLNRVAARAGLGREPHDCRPATLDEAVIAGRPVGLSWRDYTYALFDLGALHCRSRPLCASCPLALACASRARLATGAPAAPRRQAPYVGSLRQLRGAILAAALSERPPRSLAGLRRQLAGIPALHQPGALEAAVTGLRRDGLLHAERFTGPVGG